MKPYQWVIVVISFFLMFFNSLIPPLFGLNAIGWSTLCIFIGTLALLLGVSLLWPAIPMVIAFVVNGVYTMNEALSMSFGHNIVWFCLFNGLLIAAIDKTGFLRRLALSLIKHRFLRKNPWLFLSAFFLVIILLGSIMNVTAVCLLFVGLGGELLAALGVKKGDRFGELMMMGVLVFSGLSFCITPIAHPTPIMTIELMAEYGLVNYLQYSLVGYSSILIVLAIFLLASKFVFKLDVSIIRNFDPSALMKDMPKVSKREKVSAIIYIGVIILWVLPGILDLLLPEVPAIFGRLGNIAPVMIGIIIMTLVPVEGRPLMDIKTELKTSVPWEACMSMAAAMMLSTALSSSKAGITEVLAASIAPVLSTLPPFVFILILSLFCCILTCYASDTISSMLTCSIFIALFNSGAITGINPMAITIVFGCVASCGFSSPAGSTYGAIVFSSGWVRMKTQMGQGTVYSIAAMLVFATLGYFLATAIVGPWN